jgi:hypothetical protein
MGKLGMQKNSPARPECGCGSSFPATGKTPAVAQQKKQNMKTRGLLIKDFDSRHDFSLSEQDKKMHMMTSRKCDLKLQMLELRRYRRSLK